jgi:hypothetical protein
MTSSWRTAYPLFYRKGMTWNEKRRKGKVGNRQDAGRKALQMAELQYVNLRRWSEHLKQWSSTDGRQVKTVDMTKGKKSPLCRNWGCQETLTNYSQMFFRKINTKININIKENTHGEIQIC